MIVSFWLLVGLSYQMSVWYSSNGIDSFFINKLSDLGNSVVCATELMPISRGGAFGFVSLPTFVFYFLIIL
jgi:hypothetical protein